MSDLLVGCKVTYQREISQGIEEGEGIVIKTTHRDSKLWILKSDGSIKTCYTYELRIHPDDVRFITSLNKDYKVRKEILENSTDRFEILDM